MYSEVIASPWEGKGIVRVEVQDVSKRHEEKITDLFQLRIYVTMECPIKDKHMLLTVTSVSLKTTTDLTVLFTASDAD